MTTSRQGELRRRPQGWPVPDDVALVEADVPAPGAGEALVRNHYLSVDPDMRGRMNAARSYAAPYEIGAPLYGGAVGEVVESQDDRVPVGTVVQHELGWRTHSIVRARSAIIIDPDAAPLPASDVAQHRRTGATVRCRAHHEFAAGAGR